MIRRIGLAILLALHGVAVGLTTKVAHAGMLTYCDPPAVLSAAQNDRLFRVAAIIRAELEASGQNMALVSRSGLDLSRFGVRYSHAGLSLKANPSNAWAIRQLYYDCEEQKPRIFDQGISAFLLGLSNTSAGYISAVFLPAAEAQSLEAAALDNRQALQLLNGRYSANAYAFGLEYQNCNQWLAEIIAAAWPSASTFSTEPVTTKQAVTSRSAAQTWLKERGYTPTVFEIAWRPLIWLATLIPWVHFDDHPAEDLAQQRLRVSMPASLEAFLRTAAPSSSRIEFCHTEKQVVIRRGWVPIADGCKAETQDQVIALD